MARRAASGGIHGTLTQHAAAIAGLSTEMHGIKTEVHGIKSAIAAQDQKFDKLFELIRETQAKTGPGLRDILTIAVSSATLAALFAAAIIFLGDAKRQPDQARNEEKMAAMSAEQKQQSHRLDRFEAFHWDRFRELDREDRKRVSELERRGWAPSVRTI
jgi:hypothetical protein